MRKHNVTLRARASPDRQIALSERLLAAGINAANSLRGTFGTSRRQFSIKLDERKWPRLHFVAVHESLFAHRDLATRIHLRNAAESGQTRTDANDPTVMWTRVLVGRAEAPNPDRDFAILRLPWRRPTSCCRRR